jgi:hypothetical protein
MDKHWSFVLYVFVRKFCLYLPKKFIIETYSEIMSHSEMKSGFFG